MDGADLNLFTLVNGYKGTVLHVAHSGALSNQIIDCAQFARSDTKNVRICDGSSVMVKLLLLLGVMISPWLLLLWNYKEKVSESTMRLEKLFVLLLLLLLIVVAFANLTNDMCLWNDRPSWKRPCAHWGRRRRVSSSVCVHPRWQWLQMQCTVKAEGSLAVTAPGLVQSAPSGVDDVWMHHGKNVLMLCLLRTWSVILFISWLFATTQICGKKHKSPPIDIFAANLVNVRQAYHKRAEWLVQLQQRHQVHIGWEQLW